MLCNPAVLDPVPTRNTNHDIIIQYQDTHTDESNLWNTTLQSCKMYLPATQNKYSLHV